jgi:hypothetical protein
MVELYMEMDMAWTIDREIESFKGMMESCYAYGSIDRDSWWFQKYISPYIDKLGEELFEQTYQEQYEYLQDFIVVHSVYTDYEGGNYNRLEKRNHEEN